MHAHSHGHSHDHHGHSHAPKDFTKAFAVGIALNFGFVVVEAVYGYLANSLALMADAGHNLSDVLGLLLAWGAVWLSKRKPSREFTYGLRSSSILASLANAMFLLLATGAIALESIERFRSPAPIATGTMIWVAGVGIVINATTALLFMGGRHSDLNIRAAYLHMAADALVSLAVVVAGVAIRYTEWFWLDPAISLAVSLVIVASTWGLLRDSVKLMLQAVPGGIHPESVMKFLQAQKEVSAVHHLHIWGMSTTENALTVHLVCAGGHPGDAFLKRVAHEMEHEFSIHHSTIQIEVGDGAPCESGHDHHDHAH